MVIRLTSEKYKLADELFLKYGLEPIELEMTARHYDLLKPDSEDIELHRDALVIQNQYS